MSGSVDSASHMGNCLLSGRNQSGYLGAGDAQPIFLREGACYIAGTKIATPGGIVSVDSLSVGDIVLTGSGPRRIMEIRSFSSEGKLKWHATTMIPAYGLCPALDDGLPCGNPCLEPAYFVVAEDELNPPAVPLNCQFSGPRRGDSRYHDGHYRWLCQSQSTAGDDDFYPLQSQLAHRAANLEYRQSSSISPADADLYLVVDGRPLQPVEVQDPRRSFVAPRHRSIHLACQSDTKVTKIEVVTNEEYIVFSADHPMLVSGWGPVENDSKGIRRPITRLADLPTLPVGTFYKIVVWVDKNNIDSCQ